MPPSLACLCMHAYTVEPLLMTTSGERPPCLRQTLTLVPTASLFRIVHKKPLLHGHLSTPYYGHIFGPKWCSPIQNDLMLYGQLHPPFNGVPIAKQKFTDFHRNYPHIYIMSYDSPSEHCSVIHYSFQSLNVWVRSKKKNDSYLHGISTSTLIDFISSHLGKSFVWRSLQKCWHNRS